MSSFDSILKKYNLTDPCLLLLGEVVAHCGFGTKHPPPRRVCAGYRHGFTRLGLSDHEILDRELSFYDALVCKNTPKADRRRQK